MQGLSVFVANWETTTGLALAKKLNVVACDGGAGDEPCGFPECLARGCPGVCNECEESDDYECEVCKERCCLGCAGKHDCTARFEEGKAVTT